MTEADAEEAARAETDQRLDRLVADAERILERVEERLQPLLPVALQRDQEHERDQQRAQQQRDVALAPAAGEVDGHEDRAHHHGRAQVTLQHQDAEDDRGHDRER